jgi:hypothetical protein
MKRFINPLLRLGTAVALLSVIYFQNKELTELRVKVQMVNSVAPVAGDIQKAQLIDSLNDELFNAKTETGRYELSLEHLYEVNPKAAKQFTDYMEHETE